MNLVELDQGVFAYVHPNPRFGYSNVGLIIDADGLTVFDTTATPNSGDQVKQAMVELTAQLELPIKRVVGVLRQRSHERSTGRPAKPPCVPQAPAGLCGRLPRRFRHPADHPHRLGAGVADQFLLQRPVGR
jgi:hypothetical protein